MLDADLIVVGLGPAGASLGYRAVSAHGWRVLGFDTAETWSNTFGLWVEDIPSWAAHLPVTTCEPVVCAENTYRVGRRYAVLHNSAWREALLNFPVRNERATIEDARTVVAGGRRYRARWVVDARGACATGNNAPMQQALGVFSQRPAPPVWMDLRLQSGVMQPSFCYQIPTPNGMLYEETILLTRNPVPWETLQRRLEQRGISVDGRIEQALFPMLSAPYRGPAVPFGARAGLINPVTGYSVSTSLMLVDATLTALSTNGPLPWSHWGFRLDTWLLRLGQDVLLNLDNAQLCVFLASLFQLSPRQQQRFLRLGCWRGTVAAMWRMFWQADHQVKWHCVQGFLPRRKSRAPAAVPGHPR